MRRVVVHNLSTRYVAAPLELFHFDQNGLLFAEPGDVVVVRAEPDIEHRRFLEHIGAIRSDVEIVVSSVPNSPFSVFEDAVIFSELKDRITHHGGRWWLDSFVYTRHERTFAERLGLHIPGESKNQERFGTKSGFRDLAVATGVPVPLGFAHRRSALDVGIAVARLLLSGVRDVVVKQNDAEAGLSMHRIDRGALLSALSDPERLLPPLDVLPTGESEYVVEAWLTDVRTSPSIACEIGDDGNVTIDSLYEQLFFVDGMSYRGCRSRHWLPQVVIDDVSGYARTLAEALARYGVRGHVAFDAVVTSDGVFMIEANVRRIRSSYAHQAACRLRPDAAPYIAVQAERAHWRGADFARLLDVLGDTQYAPERGTGIVPYDIGMLRSHGRASFLCIGDTVTSTEQLQRIVECL